MARLPRFRMGYGRGATSVRYCEGRIAPRWHGAASRELSGHVSPLEYLCDYYLPEGEGSGIATASFDTGIGADVVVNVGDDVPLDPVTGSITLPSGFVDALRAAGTLDVEGGGDLTIVVTEHDNTSFGGLSFEATPVPETGPMTLQIEGTTWPIEARDPGTHSLVLVDFSVIIGEPVEEEEKEDLVAMFCYLEGVEGDATLDSFEVLRPPTPTTTVTTTATATATRTGPVVETDRPAGGGGNTVLASTGAAALLAGAGALLLGRRQGSHR